MDPNATLQRIRELAAAISDGTADGSFGEFTGTEPWDLASAFTDLDNWLKQGGSLPEDWARVTDANPPILGLKAPMPDLLIAAITGVLESSESYSMDDETDRMALRSKLVRTLLAVLR